MHLNVIFALSIEFYESLSLRTHCRRPSKASTSKMQTYTAASVNASMIASSHRGTSWLSAHDTTLYATSGDARSTARSFVPVKKQTRRQSNCLYTH